MSVTNQKPSSVKNRLFLTGLLVLSLVISPLLDSYQAHAATLTQVFVRFDRMKLNTPTTGTVCFKPTTASSSSSVDVTFPTGYTLSASLPNWAVSSTNLAWPTGGTAITGIAQATVVSSQTVTFPYTSATLSTSTLYCFNWTNTAAVSTKNSASASNAGTVTMSNGDTEPYSTATITDDQIVVTATVPNVFSFALSANADPLGTLSTGSVTSSPTPRIATVSTNARNGWQVWAKDLNTGLTSASSPGTPILSTTPGTNSSLTAGVIGYNTGVTTSQNPGSGGTITVAAPFVGGGVAGGGLDTTLRTLTSSTGTADTALITMKNNVSISPAVLAAADYTDTITVIGAALF